MISTTYRTIEGCFRVNSLARAIERLQKSIQPSLLEARIENPDGTWRWVIIATSSTPNLVEWAKTPVALVERIS